MIPVVSVGLALAVAAAPPFVTSGELEPQAQVRDEAARAWADYSTLFLTLTRVAPRNRVGVIKVGKGKLPRGHAGSSKPGEIWLRQARPFAFSPSELVALRHELAHQFLFSACPQASGDALFHEAFALSVSGELGAWVEDEYRGLSWSLEELSRPGSTLDSKNGRRALARLLVEGLRPGAALPGALVTALKRCADETGWDPIRASHLAAAPADLPIDAVVAVHRLSGEVVFRAGEVESLLPFGSTLKPFVVAGASTPPPRLRRRNTPEWICGDSLPPMLAVDQALSRSCNGYFLDWAAQSPEVAALGPWGEVLRAAGLQRAPAQISEAIGLQATLSLSPLALGRVYRVLAAARPDILTLLRENPRDGTLSALPVSKALEGLALKTGTVRDAQSRPRYGWIVGVSKTLVVVMVKSGRTPRSFAEEFWRAVERATLLGGDARVEVQVFGLLEPSLIEARCFGPGFSFEREAAVPKLLPAGFFGLHQEAGRGQLICLGGPWQVRFPGVRPAEGRNYAGVFRVSLPPPYRAPEGAPVPEKTRRARQGSEFIFETSRSLYAAGVVEAEDALVEGAARAALLAVVDANGQHPRHGGRPVCDTTHCQVFLGTVRPRPRDRTVLARPVSTKEWLLFSRGGAEPWREERPLKKVETLLGGPFVALELKEGQVIARRTEAAGEAVWDDSQHSSCEALRGPLKLPSCPTSARREGAAVVFEGRGRGHGLGLDLEWAKSSGLTAEDLLRRAYGDSVGMLPLNVD